MGILVWPRDNGDFLDKEWQTQYMQDHNNKEIQWATEILLPQAFKRDALDMASIRRMTQDMLLPLWEHTPWLEGQDTVNIRQDIDPTDNISIGGHAPDKEAMGNNPISNEDQDVGVEKEANKEAANEPHEEDTNKVGEEASNKVQEADEEAQELIDEGCKAIFLGCKMTQLGFKVQFFNIVANYDITHAGVDELLRFMNDDVYALDKPSSKKKVPDQGLAIKVGPHLYKHSCMSKWLYIVLQRNSSHIGVPQVWYIEI